MNGDIYQLGYGEGYAVYEAPYHCGCHTLQCDCDCNICTCDCDHCSDCEHNGGGGGGGDGPGPDAGCTAIYG